MRILKHDAKLPLWTSYGITDLKLSVFMDSDNYL